MILGNNNDDNIKYCSVCGAQTTANDDCPNGCEDLTPEERKSVILENLNKHLKN